MSTEITPRYRPPAWLRLAALAVIVSGMVAATVIEARSNATQIHALINAAGPLIPVVFVAAHVVASLIFVPRSVMALVAGMLFAFWPACLWAILGSTAGAMVGFLAARYINAGLIVPEEMARFGPALQRAEAGGWRAVAAVRLIPVLPHALTNYALGLTKLSLFEYTLGSAVGMIPETYVFIEFAASGRRALSGGAWIEPALWSLAFIALSFLLPKLLRRPPSS